MDDFNLTTLNEARNEYCLELIGLLSHPIYQGIFSIYEDALEVCRQNNQEDKYLMTFQNLLARIPKWNNEIIATETKRILQETKCVYLEDLVACVHVIMLKNLTAIRVGTKNKKVDVDIPKLEEFIHRVYIEVARRIYKNVYLFNKSVSGLERQKNVRECSKIIEESVVHVIRKNMPIEKIIRAYLDETSEEQTVQVREEEVEEEEEKPNQVVKVGGDKIDKLLDIPTELPKNEIIPEGTPNTPADSTPPEPTKQTLRFNDNDTVVDYNKRQKPAAVHNTTPVEIHAPKTIDRLEELNKQREEERKKEEETDNDEDKIKILDDVEPLDDVEIIQDDMGVIELDVETL
jgi:hypothetical protein